MVAVDHSLAIYLHIVYSIGQREDIQSNLLPLADTIKFWHVTVHIAVDMIHFVAFLKYSNTCLKRPLKKKTKNCILRSYIA